MKKKIVAVLAAASLLFAFGAYAEDNAALPGARVDAGAAVSTPAAPQDAAPLENGTLPAITGETAGGELEITEEYRWFISQYNHIRGRTVRYYDDVYCYNHGDYYLTPFAADVPQEYLTVDASGTYAVAPIVLDITDAMRTALYGEDAGEVSMFYGQYCERRGDGRGRTGFTGVHEGIDFTNTPGAPLFAILGGEVTRAGDSNGTVAVYNADYEVTVLYLHCENIDVRRGDMIEAGTYIASEGKKGSGGTYTHVEMRTGRHTTSNKYRNTILESACPYPVMQHALNVVESGRQPVTAAAVMEAQRMREAAEAAARAEAEAAAQADDAEPEIELVDVIDNAGEGYGFAEPTPEPTAAPEATLPPAGK
ncbi:MAG: M23 family metallopeptidase [Clostridia bacterium]|nr:M23 family metallopeptidase [Clostridia bacterium]